jgi:RNA polymerase sigma-70 factor (ECF subfamily)
MAANNSNIGNMDEQRRMRLFMDELYPHYQGLYAFAYRLTNDSVAADDLIQETFLRAWNGIDGYTPGSNARAWLYTVCRNTFINQYRANHRRMKVEQYDDIVARHNEDESKQPKGLNLHQEMYSRLIGDEVMSALGALNPDQRIAILLDLEDFTYEEIAIIVDCPVGTVRSRLSRGREVLKEKLHAYAISEGIGVRNQEDHTLTAG